MNETIQVLWIPDVIIHDLVMFGKTQILDKVKALEIFKTGNVYHKIRSYCIPRIDTNVI